mgnify:CR=1 FL=1
MRNERSDRSGKMLRIFLSRRSRGEDRGFANDLAWEPSVDILETETKIIVMVDISGMDGDSIDVFTDGEKLRIEGERHYPPLEGRRQFHQIEIPMGRFRREIDLPVPVDRDRTEAAYEKGILKISIGKIDPSKRTRKVDIE